MSIGDYIQSLTEKAKDVVSDASFSPALESYLEAIKIESKLNLSLVESERNKLLTNLLSKLNSREINDLLSQSLGYRAGQIRHTDFYRFLQMVCDKHNLPLSQYPSLSSYLQY